MSVSSRNVSAQRAQRFYTKHVTAELTAATRHFIGRMEMAFIATSNRSD